MTRDRLSKRIDDAPRNSNYQQDIHYAFEMCQLVLRPIGMWPLVYNRTTRFEKIVSTGLILWYVFACLVSLVPIGHYIIYVEKNIFIRVKLLSPIAYGSTTMLKYFYLYLKGTIFKRCIAHIQENWKSVEESDHRAIMLRQVNNSKNLIFMCIAFLYTGGIMYTFLLPFLSKARRMGNVTIRPLAYPGSDAFFDTQSSPIYEIIFTIHCFLGFAKCSVTTSAYSLTATFVSHICGQMQISMARLNDLIERKQTGRDPLNFVIQEHVKILRLSKNVEEALSEICFIVITESTVILCFLEYFCLMEWQNADEIAIITYIILLSSFVFNIFTFCYVGQTLTDQCTQIGPASYEMNWYNLPVEKARYVILLNVISLYPPALRAGKIFKFNLVTFSSVMQSSVVYFNVLRTMTNF